MSQPTRLGQALAMGVFLAIAAFVLVEWLIPAFLAGRLRGWDLVLVVCGGVFMSIILGSWTAKARKITTSVWIDEQGVHESSAEGRRDVPWEEVLGVRFELDDDICIETTAKPIHMWFPGLDDRRSRRQREWLHAKVPEGAERRNQ